MSWFKLDDGFHSHPKILAAGNPAVGLFCRCGSYVSQHLTDGFIPDAVAALYGTQEEIAQLLAVELWKPTRGGYLMPDYLDYNPSKERVLAERRANTERVNRWRDVQRRSKAVGNGVGNAITGKGQAKTPAYDPTCNAVGNASPDPTRPHPGIPSRDLTTPPPPVEKTSRTEAVEAVLNLYATADMSTRSVTDIRNAYSYRRRIIDNALTDFGPRIQAYIDANPNASVVDTAVAVIGLPRTDALRAWQTLHPTEAS